MMSEFKKFLMRGNVVDLAVGVIIGAAFGRITTSLVNDILMPPIGLLVGKVDFSNFFIALSRPDGEVYKTIEAAQKAGVVTWNVGMFINAVVNFLLVAFAVFFFVVKPINALNERAKKEEKAAPPPPPPPEVALLEEIRDLLKERKG